MPQGRAETGARAGGPRAGSARDSIPAARDFYWRQRRSIPAFRALVRAMEARLWAARGPLPAPALDLGCGDGQFAEAVWGRVEAGADSDERAVRDARARGAYGEVVRADAGRLPFADASFAAVASNSVLEHLPRLEPVLAEARRVLRPGGRLLATVHTDRLGDGLAGVRVLRALGARSLARRYEAGFARIQRHAHLYAAEEWRRRFEAAGFRVTRCEGYFPRAAAAWFDVLHALGAADGLTRRLFGRWVICPWRPLFRLEEAVFARWIAPCALSEAAGCFIEAAREDGAA